MKLYLSALIKVMILSLMVSNISFANQQTELKQYLLKAMQAYQVPVAGYAIIKNYQIVAAETVSIDSSIPVTSASLFQAASISKSLSAYAALTLVTSGRLKLDLPANSQLKSWKIPENKYVMKSPVTLRELLDMTSGLSVSGFPGHPQGMPLPNLNEVLNGTPPANTPPIRVFSQPGSTYFYSGGAFQVLEQLIEDTTKRPFQKWMNDTLLQPLHMNDSVFQYPLQSPFLSKAVPGFLSNGKKIKGGWNNYAIAASGGLWSTPTDLAKFAINVSQAYQGKEQGLITKNVAIQMLTRQPNTDYGLGVVVNGEGDTLNFRKAGHNLGYHSQLLMFPHSGDGAVIMTNAEKGEYIINYMMPLMAQHYHWPCYFPYFDELVIFPKPACG